MALGPVVTLLSHDAPGQRQLTGCSRLARNVSRRRLHRPGCPAPEGAVAATVLFTGLGTAIPPDDRAAFRDSGLAHLLAVAGLHIGIVMGLVMGAVRFGLGTVGAHGALRWPCKQIAAAASALTGGGWLRRC